MFKIEDIVNQVHCSDCLEFMKQMPDQCVDMVICDLPYGITACKWDSIIPFEPLWAQYTRIIQQNGIIVLTASQPFTSALIISKLDWFKYAMVWDKALPTGFQMSGLRPLKQHEDVIIFCQGSGTYNPQKVLRRKPRIYNRGGAVVGGETLNEVKHDGQDRILTHYEPRSIFCVSNTNNKAKEHPTQKPVPLFEYLIRTYSNEGDLILDNCAGSGTTGIACINTKRSFVLVEIDPGYCEIARKRIAQAREQPDLFRKPEIVKQENLEL